MSTQLNITQGQWRSTVVEPGGQARIEANGQVIAQIAGTRATEDAAVMAAAPRMHALLVDILSFIRNPDNKEPTPESEREWSSIEGRAQDLMGSLPSV